MRSGVLIWIGLAIASVVLVERQRQGCKQCGNYLPLLGALRRGFCPACERALALAGRLA